MRNLINLFLMLLLAISAKSVLSQEQEEQQPQTPPPSQGQASSSAAIQSVTGCVVKTADGFSLKTDSETYPIETEKDLSQYVNKQVKITGILEHHTGTAPSPTEGSASVITDLRLRMVATVIGDCDQPSK